MAVMNSFEVAQFILNCAYDAVDHDAPLAINRRCVVPGDIAWDNCQCGQLVIAEARRFPATIFPVDAVDHTQECGAPWLVVQYTLSITRCVDVGDANGNPPKCANLEASAEQHMKDMGDIRRAVECCLSARYDIDEVRAYELGAQDTIGPQGGCVGSNFTIFVGFLNGCGCG